MPAVDPIKVACAKLDANAVHWNRLSAMYELDATMTKVERVEVEAWWADREKHSK